MGELGTSASRLFVYTLIISILQSTSVRGRNISISSIISPAFSEATLNTIASRDISLVKSMRVSQNTIRDISQYLSNLSNGVHYQSIFPGSGKPYGLQTHCVFHDSKINATFKVHGNDKKQSPLSILFDVGDNTRFTLLSAFTQDHKTKQTNYMETLQAAIASIQQEHGPNHLIIEFAGIRNKNEKKMLPPLESAVELEGMQSQEKVFLFGNGKAVVASETGHDGQNARKTQSWKHIHVDTSKLSTNDYIHPTPVSQLYGTPTRTGLQPTNHGASSSLAPSDAHPFDGFSMRQGDHPLQMSNPGSSMDRIPETSPSKQNPMLFPITNRAPRSYEARSRSPRALTAARRPLQHQKYRASPYTSAAEGTPRGPVMIPAARDKLPASTHISHERPPQGYLTSQEYHVPTQTSPGAYPAWTNVATTTSHNQQLPAQQSQVYQPHSSWNIAHIASQQHQLGDVPSTSSQPAQASEVTDLQLYSDRVSATNPKVLSIMKWLDKPIWVDGPSQQNEPTVSHNPAPNSNIPSNPTPVHLQSQSDMYGRTQHSPTYFDKMHPQGSLHGKEQYGGHPYPLEQYGGHPYPLEQYGGHPHLPELDGGHWHPQEQHGEHPHPLELHEEQPYSPELHGGYPHLPELHGGHPFLPEQHGEHPYPPDLHEEQPYPPEQHGGYPYPPHGGHP